MRSISLTLDGRDSTGYRPLWAWQANRLELVCTVHEDLELLAGAVEFALQIHRTAVATGQVPVASQTVAAADEVTFTLDTADMNFTVAGASAVFWLYVTALDAGGDELQTLAARRIEIKAASHSELDPNPAASSPVMRLASTTPNADGTYNITASGNAYRLLPTFNLSGQNGKVLGVSGGAWALITGGGGSAAWGIISGTLSDQTDLQAALVARLEKANNLSDLTNAAAARANLGLGTLSTQNGTFSGSSSGTNTGDQDLSGLVSAASAFGVTNQILISAGTGRGSKATGWTVAEITGNITGTGNFETSGDVIAKGGALLTGEANETTGSVYFLNSANAFQGRLRGVVTADRLWNMPDADGTVALQGLISIVSDTGTTTAFTPASDTDAARGTALLAAVAAATAGQTVVLAAGVYDLGTSQLALPDNVDLALDSGAVIQGARDLSNGCIVRPGANSVIRGGAIVGNAASGVAQSPIGIIGTETGKTGIVVADIRLAADTDGFYIYHESQSCSAVLRNVTIETNYDAVAIFSGLGGAVHTIAVYNPRIVVAGPSSTGLGISRGIFASYSSTVRVYGGSINVTNGGVNVNAGAYATSNGTVELYNVTVTTSNGANPTADAWNSGGTLRVSGGKGSGTNGAFTTSGSITYTGEDYAALVTGLATKAATSHTHAASDVTSGVFGHARLGTGGGGSTKFLREDGTWQTISGGGDALTANPLSQFAATTSAQLRGVLSDEKGNGAALFDGADTVTFGAVTFTDFIRFTGTTHSGIRLNNLTSTERDALTAAAGDFIYNETTTGISWYDGTVWHDIVDLLAAKAAASHTHSGSDLTDGTVTLAKLANLATDRLLGRDTAGTGVPEALTVGGGVEFTGSGGIQRSALTGDVTASAGSGSTTIANGAVTPAKMSTDAKKFSVGFTADGGGSALSTGKIKGYVVVPYAATITGWSISANAGTATVKVWKVATGTAVPTISNVINTSGVSLSTGTHVRSSTTSDFTTTSVAAGDIMAFDLTAVATATELTFNLELTKA